MMDESNKITSKYVGLKLIGLQEQKGEIDTVMVGNLNTALSIIHRLGRKYSARGSKILATQ